MYMKKCSTSLIISKMQIKTIRHHLACVRVAIIKKKKDPWLVRLSGLSTGLQTKGLLVRYPVKAHAWVVGQVPSWGHMRVNHTSIFLSLSPSLPLSPNK